MPRQSIGGSRLHVILPTPQRRALEKLSKETGLTASEHLRRAVDVYLAGVAQRLSTKAAAPSMGRTR